MSLGKVHARMLIIGAWLAGAGIATGGSLYAVSLLGQGILSTSGQQLNVAAVNRALADDTTEPARPGPSPGAPASSASPTPRHTPARKSSGSLLASSGGNVVARCEAGGAYLMSWSPQQGYQAVSVVRGPAAQAQVTFRSGQTEVDMVVTCHGDVPAGSATVDNSGGDDGGNDN